MTATLTAPQQRAATRRGPLTFDLVRNEAGFHALAPFWDALLEQASTRTPFLRWDWVSLWWEECRGDARLAIGVLRDVEGVPQAIAPLMLAHETDRARRHLTTLTFLGGVGEAHGERFDLLIPAGREDELAPQLCQVFHQLRSQCDNVRLNHLPEESPNTPHLLAALRQDFIRTGVLNRHATRFISLPASWDEYEARHSNNWRSSMRRYRKQFTQQHAGRTSMAGEQVPHQQAYADLLRLHAMSFPDGVSTFTTPVAQRFHARLADRWLPSERAILPLLESHERVVTAIYGFMERGEFFQYQLGWDSELARLSPGKLAIRWCIECVIQRGAQVYDMLPGDHGYKLQWCDGERWLLDLEAHNPSSWRATAFHSLRAMSRLFSRGGLAT